MISKVMDQQVFFEGKDLIDKYTSELTKEIQFNRSFINSLIKRNAELTKSVKELQKQCNIYESYIQFRKWKQSLPFYKRIFVSDNKFFNELNN